MPALTINELLDIAKNNPDTYKNNTAAWTELIGRMPAEVPGGSTGKLTVLYGGSVGNVSAIALIQEIRAREPGSSKRAGVRSPILHFTESLHY